MGLYTKETVHVNEQDLKTIPRTENRGGFGHFDRTPVGFYL